MATAIANDSRTTHRRTALLTRREREVLHWIAEGKTNLAISIILGLSPATVKCHVARILAKLQVENRTAAARMLIDDVTLPHEKPLGHSADT